MEELIYVGKVVTYQAGDRAGAAVAVSTTCCRPFTRVAAPVLHVGGWHHSQCVVCGRSSSPWRYGERVLPDNQGPEEVLTSLVADLTAEVEAARTAVIARLAEDKDYRVREVIAGPDDLAAMITRLAQA